MNLFELHYTMDRQKDILNEANREHLISEYQKGHPSLGQRIIVTVGEALENAGGWMKRQAAPARSYGDANRSLPVPR